MSEDARVSPETYDTWFELLADELRRRLLFELADRSSSGAIVSVPDDIVGPNEDADTLSLHLRHVHLPKLADSNVIDWNRDAGTVSHGLAFDRIRPVIRSVRSIDDIGRAER
ncbi:DUF7344 domain-containing protein [Halobaculum roseum]|uniref:DUF7344 domain-containing protein n=1 Tax=Halobaculum roseum TaxID=2175149 RepID=A0ABD5MT27_9EURY|nr:hypothetical protein [Halobaculum roseum]QZY02110.1 hypothetical protein K6T36_12450 [Halobaculum roseum]